ncbi:MAG: 7-cyano-7-deazaguanine synthase QueC [Tepidisphaeraceae bacterium]|jgi:7-cyano-7-deazaguanine synthase
MTSPQQAPAIILTSGGLDSATTLAIAKFEGFAPIYALSFDYGQRHRQELTAAAAVAARFGAAEHRIIRIDLRQFGKSALTDAIEVPKNRDEKEMSAGIPVTYVPARNTIFLSYALAWAEVLEVRDVYIGVNAVDYSGYPDCRPQFIAAFEALANVATKMTTTSADRAFIIHAPLMQLTKAQIIRRGIELGVDYSITHSCYDPDPRGRACGQCDSCQIRRKGFAEAGVPDPTVYQS